jgi:hypothetical protein
MLSSAAADSALDNLTQNNRHAVICKANVARLVAGSPISRGLLMVLERLFDTDRASMALNDSRLWPTYVTPECDPA